MDGWTESPFPREYKASRLDDRQGAAFRGFANPFRNCPDLRVEESSSRHAFKLPLRSSVFALTFPPATETADPTVAVQPVHIGANR
jgi:hypothetical protein